MTATRRSVRSGEEVAELELQLGHEFKGRIQEFRLVVRELGLVLQGRTHTFYVKQLAQHAVMSAVSLPIVANEIVVIDGKRAALSRVFTVARLFNRLVDSVEH
jgi:hypothetical protein